MTRRDLAWRMGGGALLAAAAVVGPLERFGNGSLAAFAACCLAFVGVVLVVQGRRVPATIRIERSRHHALPHAIRERRWRARMASLSEASDRHRHDRHDG